MTQGPLGILAALPEEIAGLIERLETPLPVQTWGQRDFHRGHLHGRDCVIALSRVGKVAAASTATTLISKFDVSAVLFVGVAGGVGTHVHIGDVVIADTLMQHDMDASPLFPRFEIPLLARARFDTSAAWTKALRSAAERYLAKHHARLKAEALKVQIGNATPEASASALLAASRAPNVHCGLIASGDRFVSSHEEISALLAATPDLLAVDMESAAVGQVCHEHLIPVAILRSISDGANDTAAMSFSQFLTDVAAHYAGGILEDLLLQDGLAANAPPPGAEHSAMHETNGDDIKGASPGTQAGATV